MFEITDTITETKTANIVDLAVDIDTAEIDRKYRMYCLVLRQLSSIQKGVQSAHSIVEYSNKYGNEDGYLVWSRADKTIIMLDGGVLSELEEIIFQLDENDVKYSVFREEDLGNIVTSISILVDERVFNHKEYPDFETWRYNKYPVIPVYTSLQVSSGDGNPNPSDYTWAEHRKEWIDKVMGDEKYVFLRELLSKKRLAQ